MKTLKAIILTSVSALIAAVATAQDSKPLPTTVTDIKDAWVILYDDNTFGDRCVTILSKDAPPHAIYQHGDLADFQTVPSDNRKAKNFGDKTSAAKFCIPIGWSLILFEDADQKGKQFVLTGTGKVEEIADFKKTNPKFNDATSSCRWTPVKQEPAK